MAEPEPKRKLPRFPYVAALLCAACVGAAGWTWMRYSHVWDVTVAHLTEAPACFDEYCVRFEGTNITHDTLISAREVDGVHRGFHGVTVCEDIQSTEDVLSLLVARELSAPLAFSRGQFTGRLRLNNSSYHLFLLLPAGRHPASITGLVVGVMGVFVFTVALRHWLRERRTAMALEGP